MPNSSDVVITGLGAVTAIGVGVDSIWDSLVSGRSGITSLENRCDDGPRPARGWQQLPSAGSWVGAPITGFDAAQFVRPRKALKVMGRELQTAFAAAQMAIDASCLGTVVSDGTLDKSRIATVFGSQMLYGPALELLDAVEHSKDENGKASLSRFGEAAMREVMPLWMLKYLPNMPACHVGISIGATGANNTLVSGDVSSTSALIESLAVLRRGIADAVICGGTGSRIDETYMVYRGDWPIPKLRDPVSQSCRPHGVDADGVIGGEAAVAMVLETRRAAHSRQASILATVASGSSRFASPAASKRGSSTAIILAIQAALEQSRRTPDAIGLIVSHGMGDPHRDAAEADAVAEILPGVPMVAGIAHAGHCGAASSSVSLLIAVLSLINSRIPAQPDHGAITPTLASRFSHSSRPLPIPAVLVLSHTSQGVANAVVVTH